MRDFMSLRICQEIKKRDQKNHSNYYNKLKDVVDISFRTLENIKIIFSGYTEHGIPHAYNVAKNMDEIIGPNLKNITTLELYIILLSALLHDFGMIVSEKEKEEIIAGKKIIQRYGSFERVKEYIAKGNENIALQYIIRKDHGNRVGNVVKTEFKKNLELLRDENGNPLYNLVVLICESHTKNTDFLLEKFKSNYQLSDNVNALYIAALLRIGDLLDINSNRAPEYIFNLLELFEDDDKTNHWLKNMSVFSGEKIEESDLCLKCNECKKGIRQVCLYGLSYEEFVSNYFEIPKKVFDQIQCEILDYKNNIELEIKRCNNLLLINSDKFHQLFLCEDVKYILHSNYSKPNFKIDMNYGTIIDLLLGKSIYGDNRIGLREIIQNGLDACKYKVASLESNELESYNPSIIIDYRKNVNGQYDRVEIYDTGIGMDQNVIENYFLNIGKSLYTSDDYRVSSNRFLNAGCYGIGFFATFMLSESVEVFTKLMGTNDTWHVVIDKYNRYASIEKSNRHVNGTIISLNYKDFIKCFPTIEDVKYFIEINFLADINSEKKISIKIKKDGMTTGVSLSSLRSSIQEGGVSNGNIVELSKYLNEIDSIMVINNKETARWFMLSLNNNGKPILSECNYHELGQYQEINYIKLFFDNSFLFISPEIDPDPFMYNGDRQRSFNLLSERIFSAYDYTLKQFLDENDIKYPSLQEIPPAYIGKFRIYKKNEDVYFVRTNTYINNPEPDGGVLLVGESYYDTVYVRNVRIPRFNIVIPEMIYMANNYIMPQIKKLTVNVLKEGVNPILNRSDMEEDDKRAISYALGFAVLRYYSDNCELSSSMREFVGELYSNPNIFMRT